MSFTLSIFVWKIIFLVSIWKSVPAVSQALKESLPGVSPIKTVYSCLHNELHLRCEEGQVIQIILADHVQSNKDVCSEDDETKWSGRRCVNSKVQGWVIDRCSQKQNCGVLTSSEHSGDPCYGKNKYLEVRYMCGPPRNRYKTAYSCENSEIYIICEKGSVIQIMRANYGRFDRHVCRENGQVELSGGYCTSDKSFFTMKFRCENEQNCSALVSDSFFGNSCPGTFKYLEVQYTCVSLSALSNALNERAPGRPKTVHACENNELRLSCSEGRVIHVIQATFGRLNRELCNEDGQLKWSGGPCNKFGTLRWVNERCEQKQRCGILVSTELFGDPCYGTKKYLEVTYVCVSPDPFSKIVHACENSTLHIGCEEDSAIHIMNANYGRYDRDVCNADGHVVWSGGYCANFMTYSRVRDRCEHKRSCSVPAINTVFGNSCRGTDKYLEVQYKCVSRNLPKPAYSCENSELNLNCGEGRLIHIIKANYGRLSRALCNEDGRVEWSGRDCISDRSNITVTERCERKQTCSVPATNKVFGNPCPGTLKYLEVYHTCVSK